MGTQLSSPRLLVKLETASNDKTTLISSRPVSSTSCRTGHEIKIWTARGLATVLAEIGPECERSTGHKLIISSDLPNGFAGRANQDEPFDILITTSTVLGDWIKEGKIESGGSDQGTRYGITS
jgi:hypothetical protein